MILGLLLFSATLWLPAPTTQGPTAPVPPVEGPPTGVLERIVVIGASVSSGFGLEREIGPGLDLARFVDRAIRIEHQPILGAASENLFLDAEQMGALQVETALAAEPTLVVALDYLFWFGYGVVAGEERRMELLEVGLELLDEFECRLLVGDFPDMSPALDSEFPMLFPQQVPGKETLSRLNARLAEWASKKPNVVMVPLAEFVEEVFAGRTIELHGNRLVGSKRSMLLQDDLLHPSARGTSALVALLFDTLLRAEEGVSEDAILWDVEELWRGFLSGRGAASED